MELSETIKPSFHKINVWIFVLAFLVPLECLKGSTLMVDHLRTEHRINPVGIGKVRPRLSWQLNSEYRGTMQTSWQVQSAKSQSGLAEGRLIWDSGRVLSDQSNLVAYGGPEPGSGERVYWRVRVWDNQGQVSGWSPVAYWETGLLDTSEWKAVWIEPVSMDEEDDGLPCPYLRKEFTLEKKIKDARLYVTCHGLYELNLNGRQVGDRLFTPGWTSYHKRLQYQVYDVTSLLEQGKNAIGVILGEGWYSGPFGWEGKKHLYGEQPALLLQLRVSYADDTETILGTDESWKSATGPILKSEIYDGETFDARLEMTGWDMPGFLDRDWNSCVERSYGYGNIVAEEGLPVKVTDTIKPVKKILTPAGELVFDMGQNMVGCIRFSLQGEMGSEIILQHAEVLDKEGNFYTDNLRSAKQEIRYTFRGDGRESFQPHFSFQGFRYVKINKYQGEVTQDDLSGLVIHSDMEPGGGFRCSDSLINRLQENIEWGLRGNFLDVPTDCPQRDERMGWTGDAQVFAPTACFNRDVAAFFTKWLRDLAADQRSNGSVPWVVPMVVEGGGGTGWSDGYGATGWADAAITLPWTLYQYYGDRQILETQYGSMKAWVDYMVQHAGERCIFDYGFHFGDWLSFAEYYSLKYLAPDYGFAGAHTDKDLIATAYFYHSTKLLQKAASVLGKEDEAQIYASLLPQIREAFCREFLTSSGRLSSNTQTAYSMALEFDLIPQDLRKKAARRLAENVEHFGHLTTGFLGTPLLCHALSSNGYEDLAYRLLFQEKYPSWLYPVTMGATTIWERWDGIRPDSSFQDVGMNSFNHYAYGAIGDWLYRNAAGIRTDPDHPGFKKVILRPILNPRLQYVHAWHHSPYGKILSAWEISGDLLKMQVGIPPNSSAKVFIPTMEDGDVTEGGLPLDKAGGILGIERKEGFVVLELGSGDYHFETLLTSH